MKLRKSIVVTFVFCATSIFFGSALAKSAQAENLNINIPVPRNVPKLITVMPEKVFSPMGFDDNDNAQVVIHGELPNTCYKAGPVEVVKDLKNHKIKIMNKAYYYPGCFCLEVLVPYMQVVDLGILDAGNYDISVERPNGTYLSLSTLPVAAKPSQDPGMGPDDYTYAPVTEAFIEDVNEPNSKILVLRGLLTNSCMHYQKTQLIARQNHVLEVLPIVEFLKAPDCEDKKVPFEVKEDLKNLPLSGETLIHVRSLNGQSLNQIFNF